eukprot:TRINITY_DN7704_c0_g1_i1.p1 TRINITY_DN7704_c0_g1~~TRINITY_DN7704_c0_g1_i1.p1  ORF type:complete len:295 (+),score=49.11 TRINITY_DN7704_c0_g1_i1:41-886(+)
MATGVISKLKKVHTSAIALIPPESVWGPIQNIRKQYDKAYKRWMPHINLIYPFFPNNSFPDVVEQLHKAVSTLTPFKLKFSKFSFFKHGKSCTMWLYPDPPESVIKLQNNLEKAFPSCNDLSTISEKGFTPHLTVGQWSNERATTEAMKHFMSSWESLEFEVKEVYLISRHGEEPFEVRYIIPFQGEIKNVSFKLEEIRSPESGGPANLKVFVANLPLKLKNEELFQAFTAVGLSVVNAHVVGNKGFGFVSFLTQEDQEKAVNTIQRLNIKGRECQIKPAK